MLALATLTSLLLAATPEPPAALVFMDVESPAEKEATALLEESLRHAFSARMKVITCKEAIQDETALKKVLEERGIKSSADAPKKVGLLTDFARYGCEIPPEGPLWAAWLTAYADSRSRRREVSLRMRNLRDPESRPIFASLAEPEDHHLSWSELVERCVRRYFEEEELAEIQIARSARVLVRDALALQARFAVSSPADMDARDLGVHWKLYRCWEGDACDHFRAMVEEYVTCRRANRARSASDPTLTPLCVDPLESYDRVGMTMLQDRALPWVHWSESGGQSVTVDIPGEYVLVASSRGDVAGAQRLTVGVPSNQVVVFGGPAYKPFDWYFLLSYDRVLFHLPEVEISAGLGWSARLGTSQTPPPPFGYRGLVSFSVVARHHFTAELIGESSFAPVGVLYEFNPETGYDLHAGTLLGLAMIWQPSGFRILNFRVGLMGLTHSTSLQQSELYGPLVGASLAF